MWYLKATILPEKEVITVIGIRKMLILFVPGDREEALRLIVGENEPVVALILNGSLAALKQDPEYEIFRLEGNETPRELVARMFELEPEQVDQYKNPKVIFEALEQAVGSQLGRR